MELKKALTYEEQVQQLKEKHNLFIESDDNACSILSRVNYYRLSAYGIGLKMIDNLELYVKGTSIDTLYRLYIFDSKFRNILFHTVEHIEIQFRTQIANYLALKYGPECYTDHKYFNTIYNQYGKDVFETLTNDFLEECKRQRNLPFVIHDNKKYEGHFPIWVAVELFTFGRLTSLFSIMKDEDTKVIASLYQTRFKHLKSWLLSLVEIRNLCAHYGRIYNMPLKQKPYMFKEYNKYQTAGIQKVFPVIITMKLMLEKCKSPQWKSTYYELCALFEEYSDVIKLSFIGFPEDWKLILQPIDTCIDSNNRDTAFQSDDSQEKVELVKSILSCISDTTEIGEIKEERLDKMSQNASKSL